MVKVVRLRYYGGMPIVESQKISTKRQYADGWSVLAKHHARDARLPQHQHATGQLVFAVSGVMRVDTGPSRWIVPPQRALWVPAQQPHAIQMLSATEMRTVYFDPAWIAQCEGFVRAGEVHVVVASRLVQELVLGLFDAQRSPVMRGLMARLLLHALRETPCLPTHLPMPEDARLHAALVQLMASPQWRMPMETVAAHAAMSARSFSRRFGAEVGLSFRDWRQRARIIASLDLLAANRSTKSIAHALGFASPAAYVAAFRAVLDCTPGSFRPQ